MGATTEGATSVDSCLHQDSRPCKRPSVRIAVPMAAATALWSYVAMEVRTAMRRSSGSVPPSKRCAVEDARRSAVTEVRSCGASAPQSRRLGTTMYVRAEGAADLRNCGDTGVRDAITLRRQQLTRFVRSRYIGRRAQLFLASNCLGRLGAGAPADAADQPAGWRL